MFTQIICLLSLPQVDSYQSSILPHLELESNLHVVRPAFSQSVEHFGVHKHIKLGGGGGGGGWALGSASANI